MNSENIRKLSAWPSSFVCISSCWHDMTERILWSLSIVTEFHTYRIVHSLEILFQIPLASLIFHENWVLFGSNWKHGSPISIRAAKKFVVTSTDCIRSICSSSSKASFAARGKITYSDHQINVSASCFSTMNLSLDLIHTDFIVILRFIIKGFP